jgi:hypothetical protein
MNVEQMQQHARELAAMYEFLRSDMEKYVHDIDAHNLCSAVVELGGVPVASALYSYSNPSDLPKKIKDAYAFIIGDVDHKFVERGGMQDLHTEVRLINHLFNANYLTQNHVVTFFSSRSVCASCRSAIMATQESFARTCAFNAMEFKAEVHGTVGEFVYPILPLGKEQAAVPYF